LRCLILIADALMTVIDGLASITLNDR
jgi:hypothetical protein